jgi:protein involved in polysaccharide export with SLBB domain
MTRAVAARRLSLLGLGLLLAARAALGQTLPPASEPRDPATPLRMGDALLVRIDGLGGRLPEYREIVDSDGRIELPFLGFLPAAGKALAEVEAEMAAAYAAAGLASNATARLTFIAHFEPPPDRNNLVRIQDPRRPVPTSDAPVLAPDSPPGRVPSPFPAPPLAK